MDRRTENVPSSLADLPPPADAACFPAMPSRYLIRLRLARARRLLRETTRSMIEIGLEVGYPSPSHFAHAFQREVGVTPSEYRRQV